MSILLSPNSSAYPNIMPEAALRAFAAGTRERERWEREHISGYVQIPYPLDRMAERDAWYMGFQRIDILGNG